MLTADGNGETRQEENAGLQSSVRESEGDLSSRPSQDATQPTRDCSPALRPVSLSPPSALLPCLQVSLPSLSRLTSGAAFSESGSSYPSLNPNPKTIKWRPQICPSFSSPPVIHGCSVRGCMCVYTCTWMCTGTLLGGLLKSSG